MKKKTILLSLLVINLLSKANVNEIILSDTQLQSFSVVGDSIKSNDTSTYKILWNNNKILNSIPFFDFISITQLTKPSNKSTYKDSTIIYKLCGTIAEQLKIKLINDIISESAEEKLSVANLLKFEKGKYFESNIKTYLQNQIFDFFYNNNLVTYLRNEEYVRLLKPKPVYKLLSDTKTEKLLEHEILFIANNSKTYLF